MCNYVCLLDMTDIQTIGELRAAGIKPVDVDEMADDENCLCSIDQDETLERSGRLFKFDVFGWYEQEPVQ